MSLDSKIWLGTLPKIKQTSTEENCNLDSERWIDTLPQKKRKNKIRGYLITTIFIVFGLILVPVIKNKTRSLQKEIEPLHLVIPDQIIDRTKSRPSTFFEKGIVAHVSFANPFCKSLNKLLFKTGKNLNIPLHKNKTYLAMEGPQFSTKAESELYRMWGADIIGMTAIPEAKLAREAEICYSTIAMVTDYDCWHENEEDVSVELVIQNLKKNISYLLHFLQI